MKTLFNKSKKIKRIISIASIVILISIVFFLLRGPYLSNSIKRVIIPVLENTTREKIFIDKAVINLFPFYFQAKGLKVFDKDGNRLLWVTKTRAYIDLLALFSKEIRIRRLTLKEPNLTVTKQELERVIENVRKNLSMGGARQFSVSLKNVKITGGEFFFQGAEELKSFSGSGLFVDMLVKNTVTIGLKLKKGVLQLKDLPELKYRLDGKIKIDNDIVKVLNLEVKSSNSTLKAKGEALLSSDGRIKEGSFSGEAKIFIDSINKFFGLEQRKYGVLSFSGKVDLVPKNTTGNSADWPEIKFDLNTKGWFYLETLMELLKVTENISGRIAVNGKIHGTYPEVFGEGRGKLKDAVLGGFRLDDGDGEIKYKDKRFTLNNFTAHTYNGELKGDAYILIPGGNYFVSASAADVDSTKFFKFMKWDAPFRQGKINGIFEINKIRGQDIEVSASVDYLTAVQAGLNTSKPDNELMDRLKKIEGDIHLKNGIVNVRNSILSTSLSNLFMDGDIDLKHKKLDLNLVLKTKNLSDLTKPYYSELNSSARFKGKARGSFENPEISGNVEIDSGTVNGFSFTSASADLRYNTKSLSIPSLRVKHEESTYDITGSIDFRKAEKFFSYKDLFYKAEVRVKNGDAKSLAGLFYKEIPVSGLVNGKLTFKGDLTEFKGAGDLVIKESVVYGQQFDRIILKSVFHPKGIKFHSITAYKGESKLTGKGELSTHEKFNLSISSDKIKLSDITIFHDYPVDALFSLNLNGSGTFKKPGLTFSMNVLKSSFMGSPIGKGGIRGKLQDRGLNAEGSLLNGMITAKAKAFLSEKPTWTVNVDLKKGRYDFLLTGLFREIPENVSASVEGNIRLSGQGTRILSMQSKFSSANFSIYGYDFRNREDIILELTDKELLIKSFSLLGQNADMFVTGVVKIGKNFNVTMKGDLDIAPFRVVSNKIASLDGQGSFVVKISGTWESPEIAGEVNIKDTITSLKGLPYKIGPMNGTIFFNKDKITFSSLKTDFAGGNVVTSGVGYLKKFSLKGLYISSTLNDIKLRPIERVSVVFDGRLLYETSSKGSALSGEIKIKKAKYEKKVEWKSWLLGLKEVKKAPIEQPTFLKKTALNIRVIGSDNISIDNNVAKTPVKLDVIIAGTVARYGLIGAVEADEGSVYFRGNEFKILKGSSIDFIEPNSIAPIFHIRAKTFTGNYHINLNLDGPIDKFTLSLSSDPPLADMDILTLLTFGQVGREARGFESGIAISEATSIIAGEFQEQVTEKFKHITGFERFEIEPYTTAAGAVSPRVTVGKRLLEDKLFVIYSTSIGTTEEHIIKLEYKLGKNISLVGSRDEIGSTGADIKYKFEFK